MLDVDDPIDWDPQRIAIAGVTGAGKSTLARLIAGVARLPYTELDSLYHGPGWVQRPSFLDDVRHLVAEDSWVSKWQYAEARPLIARRADTLIWLDFPARVTLLRVFRRTVVRSVRRQELFNGNVEPPLHRVFTDPDHILRWALRTQRKLLRRIPALEAKFPDLHVVRVRTPKEADRWVGRLEKIRAT